MKTLMPIKDKKKRKKYMKSYMRDYRQEQKQAMKTVKLELLKDKPSVPRLRELLGVKFPKEKKKRS